MQNNANIKMLGKRLQNCFDSIMVYKTAQC